MKKLIVILVLASAGIAGGYAVWNHKNNARGNGDEEVRTAVVQRGPIRLAVASTGRVESNLDVEIKCKASGTIIKLPFDVSDEIEQGELLLELDPVDEDRNLKRAQVQLSASQARLAQARLNLQTAEDQLINDEKIAEANLRSAEAAAADAKAKADRMRQLLESERVSKEECETAETAATRAEVELENAKVRLKLIEVEREGLEVRRQDVRLAETQVESDQIALDIAKQRLTETKVYAPIAGTVSTRDVQIGQIISSPMNNVGGGTVLMTLSDLSRMFVIASVDESDIGQVAIGQRVDITADAFPNMQFEGKVERIATKGENVSNVVTFEVKIEVFGEGREKLKPEMTANVEIVIDEAEDALLVPSEALIRERGRTFVQLASADEVPGERPAGGPFEEVPADGGRFGGRRPDGPPGDVRAGAPSGERPSGGFSGEGRRGGRPGGMRGERPAGEPSAEGPRSQEPPRAQFGERSGGGPSGERPAGGPPGGGRPGRSGEGRPSDALAGGRAAGGPGGVRREVLVGIDDGFMAQILAGLEEGDEIVLPAFGAMSQWGRGGFMNSPEMRGRMMMRQMRGPRR